jgi:asparagine synthase (glutamine-hydrolysing)
MTAFAAILTLDGGAAGAAVPDTSAVAAVLASTTGMPVRTWRSGPCELLLAPLHSWEPNEPFTLGNGRVGAAGQVMLEGRADLARALQLPRDTADLSIVAHAVERWGGDYSRKVRGEYACVVWDARERRLTCTRDPLGIRVLYIGSGAGTIVVSNVMDAIVASGAVPDDLDVTALARFLARGALTASVATPYQAIRMVPDGHTLTVACSGTAVLTRHWQPPCTRRARQDSGESLLSGYRDVLGRAVEDRIGGRRCAMFLSGGMDSTSLAAVGVECAADMRAVTFAYSQFDVDGEVALARQVAEHLSIPIAIVAGDSDAPLEAERSSDIPPLPVDEPFLTNWRVGLRAATAFSTLAVHGEGGDALFAPPGGSTLMNVQPLPSVFRETIRSVAMRHGLPYLGIRLRERLRRAERPHEVEASWLTRDARQLAQSPEDTRVLGQPLQPLELEPDRGRAWARLLRSVPCAFAISISPDVTRQRLALTLPLMDTRVVEFVMSVPPIPWCQEKRLARAAFGGRLPSAVLARPKTPANALHETLVTAWRRRHLQDALQRPKCTVSTADWIDRDRWADAVVHGTPDVTMAAWRVLLLEAWLSRTPRRVVRCTT